MPTNRAILNAAVKAKTSLWSRLKLKALCLLPGAIASHVPTWLLLKAFPVAQLAEPDQKVFENDAWGNLLAADFQASMRQGGWAALSEAAVLFRQHMAFEGRLKTLYKTLEDGKKPRVGVFHGRHDKNAPFSHAKYVADELLGGKAHFVVYEELGHIVAPLRGGEIAQFLHPRR